MDGKKDAMVRRNYNILSSQDEWIFARATAQRISQSAVVRDVLARAMASEHGQEGFRMVINDLIQSAEGGRTLRQVLEAAYGKKAEEIGVELADINDYERDLDERIIRIYAMFDDRGRATGDVALVAGQTIWQDCETGNIVTSIDEEAEETFMQTWVRVYPDMDAVFVHNNAYDTILVTNAAKPILSVEPGLFREFVDDPGDWRDWNSPDNWAEHGDTIGDAATKYGQIVAYYDDRVLTIVNQARWDERKLFYGIAKIDVSDYLTTYEDASGNAYKAIQVPWDDVERIIGERHTGDWEQDKLLIEALRTAGAPDWIDSDDTGGWADEYGWGVFGPAIEQADEK